MKRTGSELGLDGNELAMQHTMNEGKFAYQDSQVFLYCNILSGCTNPQGHHRHTVCIYHAEMHQSFILPPFIYTKIRT
jgi:hypothetical protein